MKKKTILFVCIENACRSQMAEGFAKAYAVDAVNAYSTGSSPSGVVNPIAVRVMKEKGIDMSAQISKGLGPLLIPKFDYIITMGCKDICPFYPGAKRIEWQIPSPKGKSIEEFREIRDKIEKRVIEFIDSIIEEKE
ncbi:MAG: arsenate reductase ArsC [bacterium]|nr:arsenate reductase ArsC [bacterium]